MRIWKIILCLIVASIAFLGPLHKESAFSQDGEQDTCIPIIDQLRSAIASCSRLNSNSACYGTAPAFAFPLDVDFDAPGEQQPVTVFETIETSPNAGSVLMLLHLAGAESPVKVILFGGSELTPQGGADNIFTLQSNAGAQLCPQSPSGMVVRTETGEEGLLTVNGVEIELGSAAYIVMSDAGTMVIANLEGSVAVTVGGQRQQIPVGYQSLVVGIGTGQVTLAGPPTPSPLYSSPVGQFLATSPDGLRRVSESNQALAACGGTIAFGQTITTQISTPGQECLYTFCSEEGRAVSINLERIDATGDPWVSLRGPGNSLLKFNDDISEQNINSQICNSTLPVLGCYTIVARFDNNSTGAFRVRLNQQAVCAQPVPRCEVVALALNQREGPSLDSPVIRTLPQGTQLRPLEGSEDRQWVRTLISGTSLEGWVSTSTQFLTCEDAIPGPLARTAPVPEETVEPETEEPTPTRGPKEGPYGGP